MFDRTSRRIEFGQGRSLMRMRVFLMFIVVPLQPIVLLLFYGYSDASSGINLCLSYQLRCQT
jgi:hypothetical protein